MKFQNMEKKGYSYKKIETIHTKIELNTNSRIYRSIRALFFVRENSRENQIDPKKSLGKFGP